MNFRNCVYFSEVINTTEIWSRCSLNDFQCPLYYHKDKYPYRCLEFKPTFKALMEEAIIEAEDKS